MVRSQNLLANRCAAQPILQACGLKQLGAEMGMAGTNGVTF
ncbi:hypothetical protein [Sphingobium fluviale]|nr:hypothetical protein [Sphingobium fluviale]